jgi:hypothetical protein
MLTYSCIHSFMTEFDSSLPMGGAQPAANTSNTPAPDFKASSLRRGIILQEANPVSGVFRNIDPPTPSPPGECVPPAFGAGGMTHSLVDRGWGVNSSEDARHCSVLYICKYFVVPCHWRYSLEASTASRKYDGDPNPPNFIFFI